MPLNAIMDHFMYGISLIFGEKHGLKITQKIILTFIWVVPLSATVQYRWKTIKTGNWDLVKGDQDNLIEVIT